MSELLNRISSSEISEWIAFSQLEPFGFEIDMLGHAIVASTIANVNRKKGDKAFNAKDFMPRLEASERIDKLLQYAEIFTDMVPGE